MDIIDIIKQEHKEVSQLIEHIEPTEPGDEKLREICKQMSDKLTMHALNEEKLFYPKLRKLAEGDDELVDVFEAYTEHEVMKHLIALVDSGRKPNEKFKAELQVLGESVQHHVKEEESTIFKLAKELLDDEERETLGEQWQRSKERMLSSGTVTEKKAPARPAGSQRKPPSRSAPSRKKATATASRKRR